MYQFILSIYISTTLAAMIAFILNFQRVSRFARGKGLQPVINEDTIGSLLMCFIPILNITYGKLYWNGFLMSDEEMERYIDEDE